MSKYYLFAALGVNINLYTIQNYPTFAAIVTKSDLCCHVRSFFGSVSASRTSQTTESVTDETKDLLVKPDLSSSLSGYYSLHIFNCQVSSLFSELTSQCSILVFHKILFFFAPYRCSGSQRGGERAGQGGHDRQGGGFLPD